MDKAVRISGQRARQYVQELKLFHNSGDNYNNHSKGATLWGEWWDYSDGRPSVYAVYSYRYSWPIYINWKGVWFANEEKISRTTNRHAAQTYPHEPVLYLSRYILLDIIRNGGPIPEVLVMAARAKLLPDDLMIEATKTRITA